MEAGDADRMRHVLEGLRRTSARPEGRPLADVELSSSGGDLLEGIALGYLFREFEVATIVRRSDICLSSCALAFLGGTIERRPPIPLTSRTIEIGGQVAFHSYSADVAAIASETASDPTAGISRGLSLAHAGASVLVQYGADMGIAPGFFAKVMNLPDGAWQYVDRNAAFLDIGACPSGVEPPLGPLARQAANICNHATGWFSAASPAQAWPMSTREVRRHLLDHVYGHIAGFKVQGPLVAQLRAVIGSKDDHMLRGIYEDLREAGIPLPHVFSRSFVVSGLRRGALDLTCYVSLDDDEPDRFDLVLSGPRGLLHAFHPPPRACPRLFRYDRDEMINPRRSG
ncbi:MAG: hypothetical protein ACOY4R_20980 [Pseudomonadota bacterium]